MTTIEKIQQLSDNEALSFYQGFSRHLIRQLQVDAESIIKNLPKDLLDIDSINSLQKTDLDNLDSRVIPDEVVPVVRVLLEQWAGSPDIAPVMEKYLESDKINTMSAGAIVPLASILLMTIVSTSLKVEYKDGKFSMSYGTIHISDNAVKIVNAVLDKIPNSIKSLLVKD